MALHTFRHVLELDVRFHLDRRTGRLSRILERGAGWYLGGTAGCIAEQMVPQDRLTQPHPRERCGVVLLTVVQSRWYC